MTNSFFQKRKRKRTVLTAYGQLFASARSNNVLEDLNAARGDR
jgi:hypothetical protein